MKIAFLSFYSGAVDRGVETATAALGKGLSKKYEVTVFQAGEEIGDGVNTVRLPVNVDWKKKDASGTLSRLLYLDYWSRKICQFTFKFLPYYFRHKYDVIVPTNGGWQVVICRLISWLFRKKMVIQGNAGIGMDDLFQIHCFPDQFIAISPQGYKWSLQFVPWIKKTYIPYGVDAGQIQSVTPVELPLKKPIVLCVAAFSPYKQIDLLIKAMIQVPHASLLVIGQGDLEAELRNLGERSLGARFLLKTGVIHDRLLGYYKLADVFSLPSAESEAFGIVYVEAMAAGIPIVAPDDYNRHEIIGDAGLFIDPKNTLGYAKTIENALQMDFGDKPQKQARKFAWEKIVRQYDELLFKTIIE